MYRLKWIDVLKGIGIIYVVLGHLHPHILLETHIYSFHMFLFFFISGYLYQDKGESIRSFVIRKSRRLLIPYTIWNGAAVCLDWVLKQYSVEEALRRFFFLDGVVSWNSPVWFLVVLWETEILVFLFMRYRRRITLWLPMLAGIGIEYFAANKDLPFGGSILPIGIAFYLLGIWIYQIGFFQWLRQTRIRKFGGLLIFAAVNVFFGMVYNGRISVYHGIYPNYAHAIIAGIAGILCYAIAAQYLENNRWLAYWGRHSMFLLCAQYWIFRILDSISLHLWNYSLWKAVSTAKALIVTAAILIALKMTMRLISDE